MSRDKGLTVEIIDGVMSITIGIDALMVAARGADTWDDEDYAVVSADGFAEDIVRVLEDEEDDGTTLIHRAIDAAVEGALDSGSLNIRYTGHDE